MNVWMGIRKVIDEIKLPPVLPGKTGAFWTNMIGYRKIYQEESIDASGKNTGSAEREAYFF